MQRWKHCLVAVLAPLVLAGCGAPVGLQVASLLADGLSFLTTEKTISDHGLSAVAGEDCAVWRGLRGEEICHDDGTEPMVVAAAGPFFDAGDSTVIDFIPAAPSVGQAPQPAPEPVPHPAVVAALPSSPPPAAEAAPAWTPVEEPVDALISPESPESTESPGSDPVPVVEVDTVGTAPLASVAETAPAPAEPSVRWEAKARGGTFLIIASYHRAANAERFARNRAGLAPTVLSGKARGKRVFRVAVGPVAKDERKRLRRRLVGLGFGDVWALTVKTPVGPAELASAN